MAYPALAFRIPVAEPLRSPAFSDSQPDSYCPVCMHSAFVNIVENFYSFGLRECAGCRLQFWEPRQMPDARWYSAMYGERNSRILPLEPGHNFFLRDALAPGCGRLLDVGCGTGNFLLAASDAGYSASGIELDPGAARFAARHCPRGRVFPLPLESFRSHHPNEVFDVFRFF